MYKFILLLKLASILPTNKMKIDLNKLKSLTIENSYQIKNKTTNIEINKSKINLAKSNLYPKFNIKAEKK